MTGFTNTGVLVSNVFSTGFLTSNGGDVGGLIGENEGTVYGSFSTARVMGTSSVGGLIGNNDGPLTQSFFAGAVGATGQTGELGGLAGVNNANGTIADSYSVGTISGSSSGGGLVGWNYDFAGRQAVIANSYSNGMVATPNSGGLVYYNSGIIQGSYFDTTTSLQNKASFNGAEAGVTALTDTQTRSQSSYLNASGGPWDFSHLWMMGPQGYPILSRLTLPVTVAVDSASRTYGAANPAFSIQPQSVFGLAAADSDMAKSIASLSNVTTSATVQSPVGSYALVGSNSAFGFDSIYKLPYILTYQPGTLTVTPASLTISADNAHKAYGQTANLTYTPGGLVNGDTLGSVTLQSDGAPPAAGVGSYTVTASNAQGRGVDNYSITYQPGSLTVDPASLIISADSAHKPYGQTANLTYTPRGLVNGDTLSGVTLQSDGAPPAAGVGSYTVAVSNAQGSGLGNYAISYQPGSLTVDPASLTISADSLNKIYGQSVPLTYSVNGLLKGDSISSVALQSAGLPSAVGVGNYTITVADAAGSGLSNYAISYQPGTLTVVPAPLTISAGSLNKAYGQSATLSYSASGLVNADSVSAVALQSAGLPSAAGVGNYTVTAADAAGSGLGNYAITYQFGTLTVVPAPLTVTANSARKVFGKATTFSYTASGLIDGDSIDALSLQSPGASPGAPSGKYPILAADAAGAGIGNYIITYLPGVLTVDPAPVTSPALIFPPSIIPPASDVSLLRAERGKLPWLEVVSCPVGPPAANINLRIILSRDCSG